MDVLQYLQNCALPYPPPMLPGRFGELSQSLTQDGTTRRWHYLVMDGDSPDNGWREWFYVLPRGVSSHDAGTELILAERFVQAAVAILFMHAAGHAHHDIKVENTMIVAADHSFPWGVCVIDLGMACTLAPGESTNALTGTYAYIAPEVLRNREEGFSHGFPSDVWSLGITLFFAATGVSPFLQAHAAADICYTKVQRAQTNGQSSTASIFGHVNQTKGWLPATHPFSPQLTALIDAMLTINRAERPNITDTLGLAIAWAQAVLPGTDDRPPWLRAATAAAAAPFNDPAAIAEAVAAHAPGSSAVPSTEPAAAAPATRSLSAPSERTLTPSPAPSLAEMKAAYEKAMDEAATMSSMDEAGTGEGEAEPEMRSCSSSDGFTALSAESAEGEPAPKRPRSAAVPLLPPRPVRQNAFVLRRTPL